MIKAWRGSLDLDQEGGIGFEINAPITAGPNRFSAYAFNADNVKSANAEAIVTVFGAPRPGVAYVVTIGVNEYSNSEFNLKYAVPDADSIAAELIQHQKDLGQFSAVRSVVCATARRRAPIYFSH